MSITIEKGVPMPVQARLPKLPLAQMEIGDSFLIETKKHNQYTALTQQIQRFQKKNPPVKFAIRRDPNSDMVRVHRVEDKQAEPSSISPEISGSESEAVQSGSEQSLDNSANSTATASDFSERPFG